MNSIIQNERICFITGSTNGLQEHHIFFRHRRQKAIGKVWIKSVA